MRGVTVSLVLILLLALSLQGGAASSVPAPAGATQGAFMVKKLASYSNRYWARVSGRDTGLPPKTNGHDEFAAQWTKEMLSLLHGLDAGAFRQSFPTPGFKNLPAQRPGVNIIVSVPGSQHPEQTIVVGTHYDGEPFSRGSAYDDASGCIIMLALARTMGETWRSKGRPALTVEFVLFDAEEEGLVGSAYYTSLLGNRALMPRPVLMINEEQSGVAYPVRPFGLADQDPLPSYASMVERLPSNMGKPKPIGSAATKRLTDRLGNAANTAFSRLRTAYSPISYRGGNQPVFTDADKRYLEIGPSSECCSDNDPFELHGVPNLTLSGNFDFYRSDSKPWSYPFDQPVDTFANLACDTGGSPQPSKALEASLDLPLNLSIEMIRAYAPPARGRSVSALSTAARLGKPIRFSAFGPGPIRWEFGDGAASTQHSPSHTYRRAGTYHLQLRTGSSTTRWTLSVPKHPITFKSFFGSVNPPPIRPWHPDELQHIPGCH